MASKETVEGILALIASTLNLELPDATYAAWEIVLRDEADWLLKEATIAFLKTWDEGFLPAPGKILEQARLLRKVRGYESAECGDCSGLGLVVAEIERDGLTINAMVPCHCDLGKIKRDRLVREHLEEQEKANPVRSAPVAGEAEERLPYRDDDPPF